MAMTNVSRPSSSIANVTKINIGETWDSITTSWLSEVRTWDATGSLIANVAKILSTITNVVRPT